MNLNKLKKIYQFSPSFIKKAYSLIPWNLRMGKEYRETLAFLHNSLHWSEAKWKDYQTKELRDLLKFCSENIPYYQKQFQKYGIDIDAKDIWKEFYKIPFIDKETVTNNINDFIPTTTAKLYSSTTGGTTGKPMQIFYDKQSFAKEWAYKIFFWNEAIGYKPTDKKATFRGVASKDKLFIENPIYNEIRFSPFSMEGDDMNVIVSKLLDYNPKYIHGYPSAIEQLANYFDEHNISFKDLKGVMLISENIYEHQRKKIEEIFGCKIYSFYGHSERLIFASMLDDLDAYYAHPAYGIIELVDDQNIPITTCGKLGEIVGTGFINRGMPLLRYKTGDFSSWSDKSSKVNMPKIGEIKGRWAQEYLIGKKGKKVSLTALNMHSEVYTKIKQMQYLQNEYGVVVLNIVKEDDFTKEDEKIILDEHMEKLGDEFELQFRYVDSLKKTQAGKTKFLIQNL